MRKIFTLLSVAFLCQWAFGQNVLTTPNGNYSQNFDTALTNTNPIPPPANWLGIKYGGTNTTPVGDPIQAVVGTGSSNAGNLYSVGSATTDNDRALGTLASGGLVPAFGTSFFNNTGSTIVSFSFSGVMEQWRAITGSAANERVVFEYSTDATGLNDGTWTPLSDMDLVEKVVVAADGAVNGNLPANQTNISGTISSISLINGAKIWIRWRDTNDTGNDGLYAIDNFFMSYVNGGIDATSPTVSLLTPADNAVEVPINQTFSIRFSENIQKGTGNIYLKKADGTVIQNLDVTTTSVVTNGSQASFSFGTLALSTDYYIEVDASAFKDFSNNTFAGISGNAAWNFTTTSTFLSFNFNTCTSYAPVVGGFTQYSVVGDSLWKCTTFGNNNTGGVQMNGFNNLTASNDANEDWLISPALDLSGTTVPMVRFYSISAFNGPQLRLFVSTNYTPGNAPSTATWTELNGKFPAQNSRVWTLSDSISLAGYAQSGVYLAWVYYSTTSAATRWTLDDVSIFNSNVVPAPNITIAPSSINFGYIAGGAASYWQPVTFNSSNLPGDLTLSTAAPFQLSTDTAAGNTSSISYPLANVSGATQTFYVRFVPPVSDQVYSSAITATAGTFSTTAVSLNGLSVPISKTLEIVNWNMEWFGSPDPTLGPTNKDLQFTNALKVLRYLDADIYSLVEIVDTSRFRRLADSLGTDYGHIVCDYGTRAINPGNAFYSTNIATAQKEGFIYKKSIFSNVTARPFLLTNYNDTLVPNSSYYWWSSGRFPYIMEADASLNGVNKHLTFVLLHAKANTGDVAAQIESYNRRKAGVLNMKDSLDINYSNANIIILGDYNDKLIGTIAPTTAPDTASSYKSFVIDSTDGNHYKSITLPFVNTGSTNGGNADIDNVIVSNELEPFYLNGSAQIRTDVTSQVTNYVSTTTDHYPIYTRYFFGSPLLPVKLLSFTGKRQGTTSQLQWQVMQEENLEKYVVERSTDARKFTPIGTVSATAATAAKTYQFNDAAPIDYYNYYRLKMQDQDGKISYSPVVKIYFGKEWQISLSPNPLKDVLYLQSSQAAKLTVKVYDGVGHVAKQFTNLSFAEGETRQLQLAGLPKGSYTVEVISATNRLVHKVIVD